MDKKPYPSELQDRFIVRMPDGMRDRIKAAAEASGRSMNAEIVQALQAYYDIMESDPSAFGAALAPGLGRKIVESEFHSGRSSKADQDELAEMIVAKIYKNKSWLNAIEQTIKSLGYPNIDSQESPSHKKKA